MLVLNNFKILDILSMEVFFLFLFCCLEKIHNIILLVSNVQCGIDFYMRLALKSEFLDHIEHVIRQNKTVKYLKTTIRI
jgi:hypothetical protein